MHTRVGPRLHRLSLPIQGLGWPPPPGPADAKVHRAAGAWTVRLSCQPRWAAPLTTWLLAQGASAVDRAGDGEPAILRGRFAHLPAALQAALGLGRIELIELSPDGTVTLMVRAGEEQAARMAQRLALDQDAPAPAASLTPRQAELLRYCVSRGYCAIPRRATLRRLGQELGISTTSLSLALRRAEAKIVLAYEAQMRAAAQLRDRAGVDPPVLNTASPPVHLAEASRDTPAPASPADVGEPGPAAPPSAPGNGPAPAAPPTVGRGRRAGRRGSTPASR